MLDTSLAVQLPRAADMLIADVDALLAALKRRAFEHKFTPTIGRSHGIHAEPTTFGLKLAGLRGVFARPGAAGRGARRRSPAAISGAVGTFANVDPRVEAHVAAKLGLVEPVSTQVIPRDRHAAYFATLAVVAASRRAAGDRDPPPAAHRGLEAEEPFAEGQKGSSAMPHKRNPVLTENLSGLARVVRSAVIPALEDVALWHERDISHSSVERMIGPDATITLDFALARLAGAGRGAGRLSGDHAQEPRQARRPGELPARAAGADPKGHLARGRLCLVQRNAMKVWRGEGEFQNC